MIVKAKQGTLIINVDAVEVLHVNADMRSTVYLCCGEKFRLLPEDTVLVMAALEELHATEA